MTSINISTYIYICTELVIIHFASHFHETQTSVNQPTDMINVSRPELGTVVPGGLLLYNEDDYFSSSRACLNFTWKWTACSWKTNSGRLRYYTQHPVESIKTWNLRRRNVCWNLCVAFVQTSGLVFIYSLDQQTSSHECQSDTIHVKAIHLKLI